MSITGMVVWEAVGGVFLSNSPLPRSQCSLPCRPFSQGNSLPYKVLMKYLSLVLADRQSASQSEELAAIAESILDLYAEFNPKQLGQVLLTSSLRQLSPGKVDVASVLWVCLEACFYAHPSLLDHALSLLSTILSRSPQSHNL